MFQAYGAARAKVLKQRLASKPLEECICHPLSSRLFCGVKGEVPPMETGALEALTKLLPQPQAPGHSASSSSRYFPIAQGLRFHKPQSPHLQIGFSVSTNLPRLPRITCDKAFLQRLGSESMLNQHWLLLKEKKNLPSYWVLWRA